MAMLRHIAPILAVAGGFLLPAAACAAGADAWPDRAWLLRSLVHQVPAILDTQDRETGKFGTEPWVCTDQNVIFPLAAAWATQDAANPYYHDAAVLEAVARGGDVLTAEQDDQGMWVLRRKDNTTWGRLHMPWTYSRWVRTYALVREALPETSRQTWEKGLQLGFRAIRRQMEGPVRSATAHHAMALYLAGQCFGNQDWQDAAARFLRRVAESQDPAGFWSEHCGPALGYNMAYLEALGIYYSVSRDAAVLEALDRGARFHTLMLWPDGTPIAAVDERQAYRRERSLGNAGFSHTPVGRAFLLRQTQPFREQNRDVSADFAASLLVHGGQGDAVEAGLPGDPGHVALGEHKALVLRRRPWQVCLSAYCCPVPRNRWIQDRQNFLDVFLDGLGLVIGGGNTKLQPYWSTFTVGDPDQISVRPGDANPEFAPRVATRWVPTRSALRPDPEAPSLELTYHDHTGRVTLEFGEPGELRLHYEAVALGGQRFEAHVPLLKRQGRIRFASGQSLYLTEDPVTLTAEQTGPWLEWDGLRVELPAAAGLRWPARQYDPYAKDGTAPLAAARLVIVLPLTEAAPRQTLTLRRVQHDTPGRVYEASRLPVVSKTDTRIQTLENLGSVLLAATRTGDSMTFTLSVEATGLYELLADFVLFPRYGIVQVSVDGTPAGAPFDAYAPEVDVSGPISIGEVLLTAGPHEVGLTVTGKNPRSEGCLVSVRTFRLRPVSEAGGGGP